MTSLAQIIREEEDARVARELQLRFNTEGPDVSAPGSSDDELLARAIAISLAESGASPTATSVDETVLAAQLEEDAKLALELQGVENRKVSSAHLQKGFTPLEQRVLTLGSHPHPDQDDEEEAEDDEQDEDVVDPVTGAPLDPRIHDSAQRREDADIGYTYRRMPEKMVNKLTQAGGIVPLHQQEFRTRNKGKSNDRTSDDATTRRHKYQQVRQFRPKNKGEEEYGLVLRNMGGNHLEVLCLDATTRVVTIPGKLQHVDYISVGSVVLVKLRSYQDQKGEVVLRYLPNEVRQLLHDDQISAATIASALPSDAAICLKVLDFLIVYDADLASDVATIAKINVPPPKLIEEEITDDDDEDGVADRTRFDPLRGSTEIVV